MRRCYGLARVLVLSDIHGNLHALRAVLGHARGWDEVLVLGDLVDYGPRPGEVIDELWGLGARIVRGNHDHAVAYGVDCRCGEATHWLSVWFRENVTLRLIGDGERRVLASLPLRLPFEAAGLPGEAVHAAPANPLYEYLHPWLPDEGLCPRLRPISALRLGLNPRPSGECPRGFYLVGHTHHQFLRVARGAIVVNPGSVGQPRDGDPRAAYAIVDTDEGWVRLARVRYDVSATIRELEELGVPDPYLSALKYMLVNARVPPRPGPGGPAGAAGRPA